MATVSTEMLHRLAFGSLRRLTPDLARDILARTGGEERFFALSEAQLAAVMGFSNPLFSQETRRAALADAEREARFIEANDIRVRYFLDDDTYPAALHHCPDAPLTLFSVGDCDLSAAPVISIVGTRHATIYGVDFVNTLVKELAASLAVKPVIVSGLAYGIDIAAHRAALEAGCPTVAVLAHGLNTIYPAAHRGIAVDIVRHGGMLISEYRSFDEVHKGNFLQRNRIVAGICSCLVVAESATRGGALSTARLASDYSRDVFALPGRVNDKYSAGCNSLIQRHVAEILTGAAQLIDTMGWETRPEEGTQQELFTPLSPQEQAVIDALTQRDDLTFSDLSAVIDMPVPRLRGLLVDMEFRSLIHALPGGKYRLR